MFCIKLITFLQLFYLIDACTWLSYDWERWSSCSQSCGGGTQHRTEYSCIQHHRGKTQTQDCNNICYHGHSYSGGRCRCPSWRTGRCCQTCRNIYIAHCKTGRQSCGGSPDNIRCTDCEDPYYSRGYGRGCLGNNQPGPHEHSNTYEEVHPSSESDHEYGTLNKMNVSDNEQSNNIFRVGVTVGGFVSVLVGTVLILVWIIKKRKQKARRTRNNQPDPHEHSNTYEEVHPRSESEHEYGTLNKKNEMSSTATECVNIFKLQCQGRYAQREGDNKSGVTLGVDNVVYYCTEGQSNQYEDIDLHSGGDSVPEYRTLNTPNDACAWFSYHWEHWSSCSQSCGGGTRHRTEYSCVQHDRGKTQHEDCNNICYYGHPYSGGSCRCPSWRTGRCCQTCRNIYIAHCKSGRYSCGGSPDNIRCTDCQDPYYSGGYGRGCLACSGISNCNHRHCTTRSNTRCIKCYDDNVFFKRTTGDTKCERLCAWDNNYCWPGECGSGLTKNCKCDNGFQLVNNNGETSCQPTKEPVIETCLTTFIGSNGEKKQSTSSSLSTACEYLQDVYGNFQPISTQYDMLAELTIHISNIMKPSFIKESNFGVTDVTLALKKSPVAGRDVEIGREILLNDNSSGTQARQTFANDGIISTSDANFNLRNGEWLCVHYESLGGGFLTSIDTRGSPHVDFGPTPYQKTKTTKTICYRYDDAAPVHCKALNTCTSQPLYVNDRIIRSQQISVYFEDWFDPIPYSGSSSRASMIESYRITVHETNASKDKVQIETGHVFTNIVNSTFTSMDIPLTSDNPMLYCIILEVKDVADNVQQARRFVLYDNSSYIQVDPVNPLYVMSASVNTNYTWQTHHNEICLQWKDHFFNQFYLDNPVLNAIEPDRLGLISGVYDQIDGVLPVSGTENVDGIVKFEYVWSLNNGTLSNGTDVPNMTNQTYCKQFNMTDGQTYTFKIVATDIANNNFGDTATLHIDRSVPHIKNIWLQKGDHRSLFVHDSKELSTMSLFFEALDPHSGILNVNWAFGSTDSGIELFNETLSSDTQKEVGCSNNLTTCYCPDVGNCETASYSIPLNKLEPVNLNRGNHSQNYYFTIKATNNAFLSNIEHFEIFVNNSAPGAVTALEANDTYASRQCLKGYDDEVKWGPITYDTGCQNVSTLNQSVRTDKLKILSEIELNTTNVQTVIDGLIDLTSPTVELVGADMVYTADILNKYWHLEGVHPDVLDNVYDVINNVLEVNPDAISAGKMNSNATNRIIESIEAIAINANLFGNTTLRIVKSSLATDIWDQEGQINLNIGLKLQKEHTNDVINNSDLHTVEQPIDADANDLDTAIYLDEELVKGKKTRAVFQIYSKTSLFTVANSKKFELISKLAAAQLKVGDVGITNLGHHTVTIVFKPQKEDERSVCAFWDYSSNEGAGGWDTVGCTKTVMSDKRIQCRCNHLTNFAVLLDLEANTDISDTNKVILAIITKVGLVASITGLGLTVLTFLVFRHLRRGRGQQVLINLAVAMLCSSLIFLIGMDHSESHVGCKVVAALLHYFILVSFMWMLVEGILQYLRFVKVLGTYIPNFKIKTMIPAWGIPIIPVGVVAAIDHDLYYGGNGYCWLAREAMLYAFIIPVAVILLANIIVFCLIMGNLFRWRSHVIKSNQSERKMAFLRFQAAISIFVILGLTWVFGFLAIDGARVIFHYLFAIFNAFQGFFIFLLFTFRKKQRPLLGKVWMALKPGDSLIQEVRKSWKRLCCKASRRKSTSSTSGTDVVRSKTSHDSSATKTQSSSGKHDNLYKSY